MNRVLVAFILNQDSIMMRYIISFGDVR